MHTEKSKKVDFKNISIFNGLNSLRFIAALFVLMHHSETIKRKNGLNNLEWLGLFRNGGNAVTFFFVLSGFLITYLLLKEQDNTGEIKIKTFYLKRILRIWPLYFLLVIIGTIGLPFAFSLLHINYEMPYNLSDTWYYFVFFLPCLVTFYFGHHFLEPLWSIGVEEVFYLIWAPLFKFNKNKILNLLLSVIFIKILLNILGLLVIQNELFNYVVNLFKFEAMAIGGLGAYLLYTKGNLVNKHFLFKVPIQIVLFVTLILYLIFHSNIDNLFWNTIFKSPILSSIIVEFLFLYVIICISSTDSSIIKLKNKYLGYLGEISYGIYMYHMLVVFGAIHFLKKYLIQMNSPWDHVLYYSIVLVFTIILAAISKHFFENLFLKFKPK